LNDEEFDVGVGDVTMSDDELEKELKQLEEEKEEEHPVVSDVKTNTKNNNDRTNGPSEETCSEVKTEPIEANPKPVRCEVYDEVDPESDNHNNPSYGHHRRKSHGQDSRIDFKRLNRSLHISSTCDDMVVGREVAYRLQEEKTRLFGHVVRVLGQRTTSDIFAETKELVNQGGIKTDLGDRKRTPGGTFLYLMKSRGYATAEQVKEIFKEEHASKKKAKKRQRDANFARFEKRFEEELKKEQGQDDDGQPCPKKKKKKSKASARAVKENQDDSSNNNDNSQSSQESKDIAKDLEVPVASIDAALSSTVPTEEIPDEKPAVSERPPGDGVDQEPDGDLEDGEID